MKTTLKISTIIFIALFLIFISLLVLYYALTSGSKINHDKLINLDVKINYYDKNNQIFAEESNGKEIIEYQKIPKNTINAFIAIEDRRFFKHNGVDVKSLSRALLKNIKSASFKEGASTITQQLVKNTHLSSDKTITRKLKEIRIARKIEKVYSKEEILEKYLNTIYFGDGCYGIESASMHYFNKNAEDLTLNESAILASIIKAPSLYSPTKNIEKNLYRKNIVLKKMFEQELISDIEYNESIKLGVELNVNDKNLFDYKYLTRQEVNKIIENNPYSSKAINVYTYCDTSIQKSVEKLINNDEVNSNKSIIILDNENRIIAYLSTTKNINRQIGSTIKPLCVYAPALEHGNYYLCSKINDEKININGYSPSNFNNKYYGEITFSECLQKSLNSPAVQILNATGVQKSIEYLKKLGFNIDDSDNNLSLALGSTKNGQCFTTLCSSYGVFRDGNYKNCSLIKEIRTDNNDLLYKENTKIENVFRKDTANLMKLALKRTASSGTAKKLGFLPFETCAKTGTVGNEKGNTDAYCISFNDNFTIGVWFGNKDGELLDNSVLGGTNATILSKDVWENLSNHYQLKKEITIEDLDIIEIDKPSYDKENVVILADDNAPSLYKQKEYFGLHTPKVKSSIFSNPKIETPIYSVDNNVFSMRLCQTEYYHCIIYAQTNNEKNIIYTKKPNEDISINYNLMFNTEYTFSITPIFINNNKTIYGDEIIITKIKSPPEKTSGDWWTDDI